MLREIAATVRREGAYVVVQSHEKAEGPADVSSAETGRLLVDARGSVVGADVGEGLARRILLAGRHEDVATVVEVAMEIHRVQGEPWAVRAHRP